MEILSCPLCGGGLGKINKGVRCRNTLVTDIAFAYLKKVKFGDRAVLARDFDKCSFVKFDDSVVAEKRQKKAGSVRTPAKRL